MILSWNNHHLQIIQATDILFNNFVTYVVSFNEAAHCKMETNCNEIFLKRFIFVNSKLQQSV